MKLYKKFGKGQGLVEGRFAVKLPGEGHFAWKAGCVARDGKGTWGRS